MKTYSVLIAWCDGDDEQGSFGSTVRAETPEEAERKVRQQMRDAYVSDFEDEDEANEMAAQYEDGDTFGGSVLENYEGALWEAAALETALRNLLAQVDEMAGRCGWADHGERKAARELLAKIDAF